jgi:hypothetical protein
MSAFSDFFNTPNAAPSLANYVAPSFNTALSQYTNQQSQLPAVQNFATAQNTGANQAYQQGLYNSMPGMQQNIAQFGTNTTALLNGQIPQDVQTQVENSAAYSALAGGYGGSGMAHALTARDLGQTSLSLQQQGASNLGQQFQMAGALNPSNLTPSSLFYSPQTILSSDQQADLINQQVNAQNQQIQYQNSLQRSPFSQLMTNNLATMMGIATNPLDAYAAMQGGGQQTVSNMGVLDQTGSTTGAYGSPTGFTGTASSGGGSGGGGGGMGGIMSMLGGCCFIFMEAYCGEMPWWVRECRDEFAPESTARRHGYIRMARWLVPQMRENIFTRLLVWFLMIKPLTIWGGWYKKVSGYERGWLCLPFVSFWFRVWEWMGKAEGN